MFVVPTIGIVALVAVFAWRTTDRHVAAFAQSYLVPLTNQTIRPLRSAIRRSRRVRWVCGAIAAIVYATPRSDSGFWGFLGALAIGFGIGSIIDELTMPVPAP